MNANECVSANVLVCVRDRVSAIGNAALARHLTRAIEPQWLLTHGYDCVELYESRFVRLSDEQANALMAAGCVLSKVDG